MPGGKSIARIENIALADVVAVDADLFGQPIEDAFDGERRLVGAEPTHRSAGWIIGVDGARFDIDIGHAVGPARVAGGAFQDLGPDRCVGAGVADDSRPDGGEAAFGVTPGRVVKSQRMAFRVDPH